MSDNDKLYQSGLCLSPDQQGRLFAALFSHAPIHTHPNHTLHIQQGLGPDHTSPNGLVETLSGGIDTPFSYLDAFRSDNSERPFQEWNAEVDLESHSSTSQVGGLPGCTPITACEVGEERKSMDNKEDREVADMDSKRQENEANNPGRKQLTSERTPKRKAQNRAAQRAFRERKQKHLRDLEAKLEELQKASDNTNLQNGVLHAQVEQLWVELCKYRKRLSLMTNGGGIPAMCTTSSAHSWGSYDPQNGFQFGLSKLGDLQDAHLFNGWANKDDKARNDDTLSTLGVLSLETLNGSSSVASSRSSPSTKKNATNPARYGNPSSIVSVNSPCNGFNPSFATTTDTSISDSSSSSSNSQHSQLFPSNGTMPELSVKSAPEAKSNDYGTICSDQCPIKDEESFCVRLAMARGNINNPNPASRGQSKSLSLERPSGVGQDPLHFDWLAQRNGDHFDPVLLRDWHRPQDAQSHGYSLGDVSHLPKLAPHDITDTTTHRPQWKDLVTQFDSKLGVEKEVVPSEDHSQILSRTRKRLQTMEKFCNGTSALSCGQNARCSGSGVVVNQCDVEGIIARAK